MENGLLTAAGSAESLILRSRASARGVRPVSSSDLELLRGFYAGIEDPLADLNAFMMVAWRRVLDLHLLVEDEVLYMVASWEGGPVLWGPPIGEKVSMDHVQRAFQLLHELDPDEQELIIAYVWDRYSLWDTLTLSHDFLVLPQGTEYVYDTSRIATLAGGGYKKKRKAYNRFQEAHSPTVVEYCEALIPECKQLLDQWMHQKFKIVSGENWKKLVVEYNACSDALNDRLPLTGVVVFVNGRVHAFSLGVAHSQSCYNCMFEKTNLEFRELPAFVFSELGKQCLGSYSEINLGEDWYVDYLTISKSLWKPSRKRTSFYLQGNTNNL